MMGARSGRKRGLRGLRAPLFFRRVRPIDDARGIPDGDARRASLAGRVVPARRGGIRAAVPRIRPRALRTPAGKPGRRRRRRAQRARPALPRGRPASVAARTYDPESPDARRRGQHGPGFGQKLTRFAGPCTGPLSFGSSHSAGKGSPVPCLAPRVKYRSIRDYRDEHPVATIRRVLGGARTGFYQWLRKPLSDQAIADEPLLGLMRASCSSSGGVYAAPGILADLREVGERCGRPRVVRPMRSHTIRALRDYKRPVTSRPGL